MNVRSYGGGGASEILAAGVVWQNVIVTPEKQTWTKLAKIPVGSRFAWWERLRKVPSCWVSNRGESERFLYYDGPTDADSPVRATLKGNVLSFTSETIDYETNQWTTTAVGRQQSQGVFSPGIKRTSLFVEVTGQRVTGQRVTGKRVTGKRVTGKRVTGKRVTGKRVTGQLMRLADGPQDVDLQPAAKIEGSDIDVVLLNICVNYGLTKEEAIGMIDVWRPQFFETDGRRLLTIMDKQDYDQLCPLHMRPEPTELVRLGIVLTEL
jgi:hypothetical protein